MLCANALCQNSRIRLTPNSGTVCRIFYGGILFWLWESKGNCAFKKAAKICFFKSRQTLRERGNQRFRCDDAMVSPLPIYLPETLQFRAAPKNAVHFLYGAVFHRPGERPWTPKSFLCNSLVQKLQNSAYAEFPG